MSVDPASATATLATSAGLNVAAERLARLSSELADHRGRAERLRPLLTPADEPGYLDLRPFQPETTD
jgi:hypothetical protein